jgi:GNAT superfamily N-acetyltransferase
MTTIALKLEPVAADMDAIFTPLSAFNTQATGQTSGRRETVFHIVDEGGTAIGGLAGWSTFDWFFVVGLFVPEALRGQGMGRELMARAEIYAREQGLIGIWLDTFDFQARGFYEKLGYDVFGTLDDHPVGGKRFFLKKRLDTASTH